MYIMMTTSRILLKRAYANERYRAIKEENEMYMFIRHMFIEPPMKRKIFKTISDYTKEHDDLHNETPTRRTRMSLRDRYDRKNEYMRAKRYLHYDSIMADVADMYKTDEDRYMRKLESNRESARRKRIELYYDGDPTECIRKLFK